MAYGVRSQKFLCCLPVRFGVFILSLSDALFYGFLSVALWVRLGSSGKTLFKEMLRLKLVKRPSDLNMDRREKISVILAGIVCTLKTFCALMGFYGSIARRLSLVKLYSSYIAWLLGVSLVFGLINIIMVFMKDDDDLIEDCIASTSDKNAIDACHHITALRYVIVALFIVAWLINLYECVIFARYVHQLEEEQNAKILLQPLEASIYQVVPGRESLDFPTKFRDNERAVA